MMTVQHIPHIITVLKFWNCTIKDLFKKIFEIHKAAEGLELLTCRPVADALIY